MSGSTQSVPVAPPPPPVITSHDVLEDLLADEDDEYREKRFQKDLQFRMVGAIEKEDTQLLQELLEAGVNTNATILLVKTPLIHTLEGPTLNRGILQLLLGANTETDPNLAEKTPSGLRPLHIIAKQGFVEMARLFLESSRGKLSNIDGMDSGGATPLHFAIFYGMNDMARYLINSGADIFKVDNVGRTTLHRACETHNYEIAEMLLEKGVCIDTADKFGWTPLFHSVFFRHTQMVRFLIDRGADVTLEDVYKESLIRVACYLQWAVERGKHYPVKISIGSSFDYVRRSRMIPSEPLKELLFNLDDRLYGITVFTEHFNMLKLLINSGADPNTYPTDGHAQTGIFDGR